METRETTVNLKSWTKSVTVAGGRQVRSRPKAEADCRPTWLMLDRLSQTGAWEWQQHSKLEECSKSPFLFVVLRVNSQPRPSHPFLPPIYWELSPEPSGKCSVVQINIFAKCPESVRLGQSVNKELRSRLNLTTTTSGQHTLLFPSFLSRDSSWHVE